MRKFNGDVKLITNRLCGIHGISLDLYYLSSVLFRKYGEDEKSDYCLNKSVMVLDCAEDVVGNRELGFEWKKRGDFAKAKKAFTLSAEAGDPISQYELAKLFHGDKERYQKLLEDSSTGLIQARVDLYRLQLDTHRYEAAYYTLIRVLRSIGDMRLEGVPRIDINSVNLEGIPDTGTFDGNGKINMIKTPTLLEVLYEIASISEDKKEQLELYHLGAARMHAPSIIAIAKYEYNTSIKEMIKISKQGDSCATQNLIQLIKEGNNDTLMILLEHAIADSDYYIKIVEEGSRSNPLALFTLGQMYKEGIGVKQNYNKGAGILKQIAPTVEQLAQDGNILAKCYTGWFYEDIHRNYKKAESWYGKAALQGNILALYMLGRLYTIGIPTKHSTEISKPDQGVACYEKCVTLGYSPAYIQLGYIALRNANYQEALELFERAIIQGVDYRYYIDVDDILQYGNKETKHLLLVLSEKLANNKEASVEARDWAQGILKIYEKNEGVMKESVQQLAEDHQQPSSQSNDKKEEELEAEKLEKAEKQKTSTDKLVLFLVENICDNPQAVAEAQVSALMSFVGKNVSAPKTQMVTENYGKGKAFFNEELRSSVYVKESSPAKASLVTLTQAAFLDEKLVSQAEYFAQTGFAFATLREAAEVGTVHILGGLPPAEEESILDSVIDWMCLSHLSEYFLEDFSVLL